MRCTCQEPSHTCLDVFFSKCCQLPLKNNNKRMLHFSEKRAFMSSGKQDSPWKGSSGWMVSWTRRARARQKSWILETFFARAHARGASRTPSPRTLFEENCVMDRLEPNVSISELAICHFALAPSKCNKTGPHQVLPKISFFLNFAKETWHLVGSVFRGEPKWKIGIQNPFHLENPFLKKKR